METNLLKKMLETDIFSSLELELSSSLLMNEFSPGILMITNFSGDLVFCRSKPIPGEIRFEGIREKLGDFEAAHIDMYAGLDYLNENTYEILDTADNQAGFLHAILCDTDRDMLKPSVMNIIAGCDNSSCDGGCYDCDQHEIVGPTANYLQIRDISIIPNLRGQGLGLALLRRILRQWRSRSVFAAIRLDPAQFSTYEVSHEGKPPEYIQKVNPEKVKEFALERVADLTREEAVDKLAAHFSKLGFKRLEGTDVMIRVLDGDEVSAPPEAEYWLK